MSLEDAEDEELDAEAEEVAVAVALLSDSTSVCVSIAVSVWLVDSTVELSWVTEGTSLEVYTVSVADDHEALSVALGNLPRVEIHQLCQRKGRRTQSHKPETGTSPRSPWQRSTKAGRFHKPLERTATNASSPG